MLLWMSIVECLVTGPPSRWSVTFLDFSELASVSHWFHFTPICLISLLLPRIYFYILARSNSPLRPPLLA